MYFVKKIPSQGVWIYYKHNDEEYQIAIMRWTDGLNPKVEKAVKDDADRIVTCLNYWEGTPTENIKLLMKNNKSMHKLIKGNRM